MEETKERRGKRTKMPPADVDEVPADEAGVPEEAGDATMAPKGVAGKTKDKDKRGFTLAAPQEGEIDFLQDKRSRMTYGRKLALFLGSRFSWYNPHLGKDDEVDGRPRPSLAEAWAFFEHVTLSRYVLEAGEEAMARDSIGAKKRGLIRTCCKGDRSLDSAEPGEKKLPTKLYSPLTTPLIQLGDFGLGYGIYFSTLRAFATLCFVIGLINIPNILYFSGDDYSNGQEGITGLVRGSAICTNQVWVPCPTCTLDDFTYRNDFVRTKIIFGDGVVPNSTGMLLNVTQYVDLDVLEENFIAIDETNTPLTSSDADADGTVPVWFVENGQEALFDDHGIRVTTESIDFNGEEVTCDIDCFYEFSDCFLYDNNCYLNITGTSVAGDTGFQDLPFALKNDCDGATLRQGFINYASLIIFAMGMIAIRFRQNDLQVKFDTDEQTAQDYSVAIMNPPEDATDPNEWKEYFESNFEDCQVTVCTVGVDNDEIARLLVRRREIKKKLELMLPADTPLDLDNLKNEAAKAPPKSCFGLRGGSPIPKLVQELGDVEMKLSSELTTEKTLGATDVFVTFEMEKHQRDVLSTLSLGAIAVKNNDGDALPDLKYLFRGELVLEVVEPDEPSTIRWQELHCEEGAITTSLIKTNVITIIVLILSYVFITVVGRSLGPVLGGYATTIIISIFPMIAKGLMGAEHHRSETSRQKWLFIKVATFNILITAVLINVNTPFTNAIDPKIDSFTGMITSVHVLMWASISTTPVLQFLDISGNIQRHLVAPRATTQEGMNMSMRGSEIMLAERYGQLYKYLFLIVWFTAVYPQGFFLGSAALFVQYFSDRFSMMRSWARTPQLGSQISDFARNYFNPFAILVFAVISGYTWAGFSFDNLCLVPDATLDPSYPGEWNITFQREDTNLFGVTIIPGEAVQQGFDISVDSDVYQFCNQDLRTNDGRRFPPFSRWQPDGLEWMTSDQEQVVDVFGWTVVVVLLAVIFMFLFRIVRTFMRACKSDYAPVGRDMQIPFTDNPTIDCYIPQVLSRQFAFPLVLCDISGVDPELFNWTDHDKPHSYYDISQDVNEFLKPNQEIKVTNAFAQIKYWRPAEEGDENTMEKPTEEDEDEA